MTVALSALVAIADGANAPINQVNGGNFNATAGNPQTFYLQSVVANGSNSGIVKCSLFFESVDVSIGSRPAFQKTFNYANPNDPGTVIVPMPNSGYICFYTMTVVDGRGNTAQVTGSITAGSAASAQDSGGTTTLTAASVSAYSAYVASDPSFGTLTGGNNAGAATANRQAIQAMVNAVIADNARRPGVVPRDPNGGTFYFTDQPIFITDTNGSASGAATIRHEHTGVQLRPLFIGDAYYVRPPTTAPTPTLSGNFWMVQLNTSGPIRFDTVQSMSLQGRAGFSIQFALILTATSNNSTIMAWSGSRSHGEATTSAFKIGIGNSGQVQISGTNTTAGTFSLTGATVLSTSTRYWIEAGFDGLHWRIFVNGVQDAILTLGGADTIQQGWETIMLGGSALFWPLGDNQAIITTCQVGNPQIRNHAAHTSNYTPPTTETTTPSDGDMMILSFVPAAAGPSWAGTSTVNLAGAIVGRLNLNTEAGLLDNNNGVWLLWSAAPQGAGVILENIGVQPGLPGSNSGIWIEASPKTQIRHYVGSRLTSYNNTYEVIFQDLNITVTSLEGGSLTQVQPKVWGFNLQSGGPQSVYDMTILGGDVSVVATFGGYFYGRQYLVPQGAIQMLIRSDGGAIDFTIDGYSGNDETKLTSDAALFFSAPNALAALPGTFTLTAGSTSVATTVNLTSALAAKQKIQFSVAQPGIWYTIQSITSSTITLTVPYGGITTGAGQSASVASIVSLKGFVRGNGSILQTAAQPLIMIDGGTSYTLENVPWCAASLGGYVFKFLNAPTGVTRINGAQHVDHSQGTPLPWMPPTGSAGQGLLYVEDQQTGKLWQYACPDTAYTLTPDEFTWGYIAPVGVLTATRVHTLPLIAGYVWNVDNTKQTGTPQSVTYKGLSDPGSGVTIAAGKRARIAIHDVTVGVVRLTPDT